MYQYVTLCEEGDSVWDSVGPCVKRGAVCGPVCDLVRGGGGGGGGAVCVVQCVTVTILLSRIFEKAVQCEQNPDWFSKCGSNLLYFVEVIYCILFKYL